MKILSPFTHVTLVDDRESEISHILNFLQNDNIPYTYYKYDGTEDSLPENQSDTVRVLFMDLYLLEDGSKDDEDAKNVSGRFMAVLSKIIKPNTPYVLIIWSKHISGDEEQIDPGYKAVIERLTVDTDLTPLAVMPLDKTQFLSASDTESGQLDTLAENGEDLENAIISSIGSNTQAHTLLHWSNLIGYSANLTLCDLREIIAAKEFNDNYTQRLFFEFARAYLGKNISSSTDKYKATLHFITDIFEDNLEDSISSLKGDQIIDLTKNNVSPPTKEDFAYINSKVLFSTNVPKDFSPGCTFSKSHDDLEFYHSGFYAHFFNIRKKANELRDADEALSKNKANEAAKAFFKEEFKKLTCATINVTPVCDFAQSKHIYHKYCHGVLYPIELGLDDYLSLKNAYFYVSPLFYFKEKEYIMIIDFRLITHDLCDPPEAKDFLFRLREQMLVDIQFKLSNHIGRPGVVFMDTGII